jgi:hypothetical protein
MESEVLFNWLRASRANKKGDEKKEEDLSFDQFGDFSSELVAQVGAVWFPGDPVKQGQLLSAWKRRQGFKKIH